MKNTILTADLQAENIQLNKRITELENTVAELSALVKHFEELFKLSQLKKYGASSEKNANELLNIFEESETEEIAYKRPKRKGKRETDLSKLPLEVVEHDIPEEERGCLKCGEIMQAFGIDTRDEIKIIPAKVVHVQHQRKVYKCNNCAKNSHTTPIIKADMPEPVIKGSAASASAVAYIMSAKYLMHLPFYRLEQDFLRQGVFVNRQNMANWSIQVCEDWLLPVYHKLCENLLRHNVLHGDESTLQVLRESGKTPQSKSYMWLYRTSGESKTPIVLYEYQPSRHAKHPEAFLKNFKGYIHTDGYDGYHDLSDDIIVVGCFAHVRRKFFEAFKITVVPDSPAKIGLDYCDRLFDLEREFANLSPDERFEQRVKFSKPVAEEFFAWLETLNVPRKLAVSRAISYALNQKKWLLNIFLDGRLELSNNRAERSIKPIVMGRKNWLFCNSVRGAKASAVAFSIIESAKENGVKPFEYLNFLFETLPNLKTSMLDDLLPWSDKLPPHCRNIPIY